MTSQAPTFGGRVKIVSTASNLHFPYDELFLWFGEDGEQWVIAAQPHKANMLRLHLVNYEKIQIQESCQKEHSYVPLLLTNIESLKAVDLVI